MRGTQRNFQSGGVRYLPYPLCDLRYLPHTRSSHIAVMDYGRKYRARGYFRFNKVWTTHGGAAGLFLLYVVLRRILIGGGHLLFWLCGYAVDVFSLFSRVLVVATTSPYATVLPQ